MAIKIDNRTFGATGIGVNSLSYTATISSGLFDSILIVLVSIFEDTSSVTSVVWDSAGAPMPLLNTVNGSDATQGASNCGRTYLWFRTSPSSGSKEIKVTTATVVNGIYSGCESIANVNQISTFNSASPQGGTFGSGTDPSTAVTTVSGEWVIDNCSAILDGGSSAIPVVGAGQTEIYNSASGSTDLIGFGSDEAATSVSTTMDWTGLTIGSPVLGIAQVCISLKPSDVTSIAWKKV